MFLRRQSKNRRLDREHILDVKLRSGQVRAARNRIAAIGFAVIFGAVFSLYLLWRTGEWALDKLVYQNDAFSIQQIEIHTDGVIALEQLRRWAGVRTQQNLLALDLGRVKRDLELVPLLQSASVERLLPRTLRIHVAEREPLAQLNLIRPRPGGGIQISILELDREGYVMPPLDASQRAAPAPPGTDPLPIIGGINPTDAQPGRQILAPQLQAALQFIAAFDRSPMAEVAELRRIDISAQDVLLVTTSQGAVVTFAFDELEQQLRRWRAIYDLGQTMTKLVATLDLAITDNIPTTWLDATGMPAPPPRPPKDPRLRKKHV